MLLVSEADVSRVLTMRDAVDCVERALADHARGSAIDVPRERTRTGLGTLSILQGAAPQAGVTGYKAYYATPQGSRSHVYLYDAVSGVPLALIEANFFNVLRTGAASAAATRHLARRDATVLGQIGAGRIGAGQLEGVCAVRPIRSARVYARTRDRLEMFCADMSEKLGIEVLPADSAADAVRGADIVNVITKSAVPVLAGAWLTPGQHVNAAGNKQSGPVNHHFVRCVVTKIVSGKALAAVHIENMGKASNAASGDFGLNPQGRDDLAPVRCRAFACLPTGKPRSTLLALWPNRRRRTHEMMVNRP